MQNPTCREGGVETICSGALWRTFQRIPNRPATVWKPVGQLLGLLVDDAYLSITIVIVINSLLVKWCSSAASKCHIGCCSNHRTTEETVTAGGYHEYCCRQEAQNCCRETARCSTLFTTKRSANTEWPAPVREETFVVRVRYPTTANRHVYKWTVSDSPPEPRGAGSSHSAGGANTPPTFFGGKMVIKIIRWRKMSTFSGFALKM